MALSFSSCYYSSSSPISTQFTKKTSIALSVIPRNTFFALTSSNSDDIPKLPLSVSADSSSSVPKARFVARRTESVSVRPLERPLLEYMSLPASQYSVLDAQRIERIDDNTFRCYVYNFKFFAFEVCPVLLVRVEEQLDGCSINLLSCKLEGSPIVVAQNDKFEGRDSTGNNLREYVGFDSHTELPMELREEYTFETALADLIVTNYEVIKFPYKSMFKGHNVICLSHCFILQLRTALTLVWYGHAASMVNRISCDRNQNSSSMQQLTSDTVIEVSIDIPFPFRAIPVQTIESSGTRVLEQILKIMLPRFMAQLMKDYQAWASGDTSRQPLGTGGI